MKIQEVMKLQRKALEIVHRTILYWSVSPNAFCGKWFQKCLAYEGVKLKPDKSYLGRLNVRENG